MRFIGGSYVLVFEIQRNLTEGAREGNFKRLTPTYREGKMKVNEVEWREMKVNEVEWREINANEDKWREMKFDVVKRREMKGNEGEWSWMKRNQGG